MWYGVGKESGTNHLYVGIVGANKDIKGKQSIASRLKQHECDCKNEFKYGLEGEKISILKFRHDLLDWRNCRDDLRVEVLKTAEMRVITTLISLIPCDYAQKQVEALISGIQDIKFVLLNKHTAYHHKK